MKNSIIFKTLLILGSVIIAIFLSAGYLFSQNDKKLINEIREYNLNSAMKALDKREEVTLNLNKEQVLSSIDRVSKNSALFLENYDVDGLKTSLMLDLKKEGLKAIKVWDSVVNELFLLLVKQDGNLETRTSLPKEYSEFLEFKKEIIRIQGDRKEKIGTVTFYYDESIVKDEIKKLKVNTVQEITNFNQNIDKKQIESNLVKFYIMLGTLITILVVASLLLIRYVNNPLKKLQNGLNEFFMFLQNRTDSVQKIEIDTNDEFGDMANSLNENISVSARLHEEIHELNTNLERRIEEKTQKVTTLLNNADQGFLSFGEDMCIDDEYSKECTNIFKEDITNKNIADLLFTDQRKKEFFIETLRSLLNETNEQKIKTIISLLQSEFIINRKAIHVKYKIIDSSTFMLILTDVTAKKILQKKINREKDILKMIVAVVTDSDEFFELVDDFKEFIKAGVNLIDESKTPLHNATEIYRIIHTFKGLFSQKDMNSLVSKLHDIESVLSDNINNQSISNKDLKDMIETSEFSKWLDCDISIIKEILGEELFEIKGKVTVEEKTLSQIENKIVKLAQKHGELELYEPVVNDIKSLKNKTIYSLFSGYPKLIDQLSQKLEKSIYPLEIIVDKNIKVEDRFKPFTKSLVHLFRNAIDHGIESMDERLEVGKDEVGTISCTIKESDEKLHITIADDGRGLDIEKIKEKAKSSGLDVDTLDDIQIKALIFNDRFSTKDEVSDISGRGVGMSAVKAECDKLNGVIKINSQKDVGTTIEFIIPL